MKLTTVNKSNVPTPFKLAEYEDYVIRRIVPLEETGRRGSGKNNCSGYNLWLRGWDGMTVYEYQWMIEETCDRDDPQYSKSKHLNHDIRHGLVELVPPGNIDTQRINKEVLEVENDIKDIINNSTIKETEKAQLVNARVGHGQYRNALLKLWKGCAVTGYKESAMLIASHIKPWSCCNNQERLDQYNGFLLIPTIDRAFDQGYITFSKSGRIVVSPLLHEPESLGITEDMYIHLHDKNEKYLIYHRENKFKNS